jgi:hypothetical protein
MCPASPHRPTKSNAGLMRSLHTSHPNVLAEKACKRLDKSAKPSLVFFDSASKGPDGADLELGPTNHVLWMKTPRPFGKSARPNPLESNVEWFK